MRRLLKHTKKIALFFALLMATEFILPNVAYGLTSGPSQPETQGFEPIGNSDMVDLFSGDFSYNIPLMDIGGYPINVSYHSGASMDDEASWVGYGWGLNVGSLNRQLRGIPDDFNGVDKMEREMNTKDHITKGGKFSMTVDLLGIPVAKLKLKKKKKKKKLNLSLTTLSVGVKHDNYRGIGMEIGANPGLSLTDEDAGKLTGSQKLPIDKTLSSTVSSGFDISSSSMDGAGVSINNAIFTERLIKGEKESKSHSIGFGYNTRSGAASLTVDLFKDPNLSFGKKLLKKNIKLNGFLNSFLDFSGESYAPTIDHPTTNNSFNFSLHLGPELWVAFGGIGVSGFYSKQKISQKIRTSPAYGYLFSEKGKDENEALMDFNREKDIPYSNEVKYLPIPVPNYDLFTASSQDGSGQYRLYRGSSGVFFDQRTETNNDTYSLGIEAGAGTYFDVGADLYKQDIKTVTKKWTDRNEYLPKGDFQNGSSSLPLYEPAYFKRVGEPVPYDDDFISKIKGTSPVAVSLPGRLDNVVLGAKASALLRTKTSGNGETISVLKRDKREVRNTTFSYLTAKEASQHALDKTIKDYHPDSVVISGCSTGGIKNTIGRTDNYRKKHHFSEITVTGDDGKRSVYGIPVYNTHQEEVSFSVTEKLSLRNKGLISYSSQDNSTNNQKGRENFYSKEKTPAYATSYLLTAILSPDFVDVTSNGVTDDDPGTAVKFNYTKLNSPYKWRTPIALGPDTANYNEGFMSDALDDKANYVYGEKETWYTHSIESKTMIAHFVTEDREDGLGVSDNRGGINSSVKLKRLKEIRLYSKSDLKLNGNDPSKTIPIKVAHFVYDYSICKGLPNSVGNTGKLTLKRIYFTFGQNQKGKLNPYDFRYDTTYNFYNYRQYDRWGNFKDATRNPGGLNNSEYPYTLQNKAMVDSFASAWQLNKIILPSGGSINISYESDDYAYVQDRRASQMCMLNGVGSSGNNTGLRDADYIYVNLPRPITSSGSQEEKNKEMRERYFEGVQNLYYKFLLDLDGKGHSEFVPGYAELDPAILPELATGTNNIAKIKLKKKKGINPIARDGWQFIRTNLPKYAYPGSENLDDAGSDLAKSIKALVTAFTNIKELFSSFEKRAKNKGFSNKVDLSKSWVRLCSPEWKKLGGGSRVKRIDISDDWAAMSGATGAQTSTYSQVYDYTNKDSKGRTVSTGVASYEPMLGNDENPFRQPIRYGQREFLGLNNYYYIEEPFGESFFPGASVGYSKVTVKTIGTGDEATVNRTGTVVSEFYTAKDYPVKVDVLGLEHRKPPSDKIFRLIGGIFFDAVGLSQGYSIELNDMHGKPRSVKVYNKSGQNISSVDYFYKSVNELASKKELKNDVKVINPDGTVADGTIGMDVEMFTDMRQQTTENLGVSVKVSGGSGAILIFPLPFFFPGIGVNYDKRNFRSSSTVKIINRFAIQYKVMKMENGSTITSENLLWDAETGNVLLTKTQNEFDEPVYSFAYPAHWKYEGMGQAYKNLGTVIIGLTSDVNGVISGSSPYYSMLYPGDELIDINLNKKYWVINTGGIKKLINEDGELQQVGIINFLKLIRSGRRNMANTAIATIASLSNPIVGDRLDISLLSKILDAKATLFDEVWSVPVKSKMGTENSNSCGVISLECMQKFLWGSLVRRPSGVASYFYSTATNPPVKVSTILTYAYGSGDTACRQSFLNGLPDTSVSFYQYNVSGSGWNSSIESGDSAQLGNCKMHFDFVSDTLNNIGNNTEDVDSIYGCYDAEGCLKLLDIVSDPNVPCGYAVISIPCPLKLSAPLAVPCDTDTVLKFHMACPQEINGCLDPVGKIFNPYYTGVLGNWRPESQNVYQVNRGNLVTDPAKFGSTNIRKSGAYSVFNPFWKYNSSTQIWDQNPANDIRWVAANEVTYFNSKGLEVENKDALNRYSSALFGYLESMPVAVASNSRYREIAFDGFEDYGFKVDCSSADTCNNSGHFNFNKNLNGSSVDTTSLYSHSGKYSLKLSTNTTLAKTVYTGTPGSIYSIDGSGRYILGSNELAKGFSPLRNKKYVLSFWLKDTSRRNPTTYVQASINGTNLLNSSLKWPVVEGWKRVETQFTLSSGATSFILQLNPGSSTVHIDDIRIHPFDGQMKSFAYDPSSQRLMAEMDENNFATFYEYDDEGILIRVKKETERGIMTIKETRSSYRKR